jgi:transcriptional regulator with XRE-family HTH domain
MSSINNKKISHSGQRLKKARDSMELSQEKFALRLGYTSYQPIKDLESGRKKFRAHIAKLIQCEFGISETWLLEGEGDVLVDDTYEKPIDVQEIVESLVAEPDPLYGEKLPPEDEKLAEIRAYIEDVLQDSSRAKRLFVAQFLKCFEEDFSPWSKTRSHATRIAKSEEE